MNPHKALIVANAKASVRDFTTVFFTFAFPLIFLLIFGSIFGGQEVDDTGRDYIEYIAPGILSWGVANAALFSVAFQLMQWRDNDLLRLIRMSPTRLSTMFSARLVVNLVIAVVQAVLFVGVAMLPFFGLRPSGSSWELIPMLFVGVLVFSALGAIVGTIGNTPEAIAAISNFLMIPMAFLSGSFLPIDLLPDWVQGLSRALPLRYFNDGFVNAIGGHGDMGSLLFNMGILLAFGVVFAVVAARIFRWSNQK